ncbi:lipopolysaccharide biosynthesis protein [Anatilimnocola floriformis]|uniref:lipopolysaccharide biosynthesis protein n=1 Tax=Anatilimnocola floriformis TaxID=2948575 RepID=UPI0020C4FF9E|nr:hypothetical protein [Anatilimnocola floriformis]
MIGSSGRTSTSKTVSSNAAWLLVGNAMFAFGQYGVVILIARWGTAEMLGRFALATAIVTPIVLLSNCALRTIQATDVQSQFTFGDYAGFRLVGLTLTIAVVAGIGTRYDLATWQLLLAVLLGKVLESIGDLLQGALQRRERMDVVGFSQLIKGIGSLTVFAVGFAFTGNVFAALIAAAVVSGAFVIGYDLPAAWSEWRLDLGASEVRKHVLPRLSLTQQYSLAKLALPMGVTVMLGSLLVSIPRFVIEGSLGAAELGVFAALSWLTLLGNLFASAVAHASLPPMSRYYAAGQTEKLQNYLNTLLLWGTIGGAVACLATALAARPIVALILGHEYAQHSFTLLLLVASMGVGLAICFLDHALYAARKFQVQVPLNIVGCLATAAGCWLAVPRYGLPGVAATICLVSIALAGSRWIIVQRTLRSTSPELADVVSLEATP